MRLLLRLKSLLTHLQLRVDIDWHIDHSLYVCGVYQCDGHLGQIAGGISSANLSLFDVIRFVNSMSKLHYCTTQGGLAMLKTNPRSKWSVRQNGYLFTTSDQPQPVASLHISICASSCHFSFHRLWMHPFFSNLQGLAPPQQNYPNILPPHALEAVCSRPTPTALMGVSKADGNKPDVHNVGFSQQFPCWSTILRFSSPHERWPLTGSQPWSHSVIRFHAGSLLSCYNVS